MGCVRSRPGAGHAGWPQFVFQFPGEHHVGRRRAPTSVSGHPALDADYSRRTTGHPIEKMKRLIAVA